MKPFLGLGLLGGVSLLTLATTAHATPIDSGAAGEQGTAVVAAAVTATPGQQTPPSANDPADGSAADRTVPQSAATSEAPAAAEIVITGSRLIQNGNNSPTPLTVVSSQQLLELQPTSVGAALQNLPVFQGSMGQNTGTGGSGSNGGPNGSANAPNIRNLGLFRNLTLFDGRRLQPTTDTGLVTIDMIPQMLLQRVDVVTGGVSAVYGSDAISGVVNFVTDRKFDGIKLKAQYGISGKGDGPVFDAGIAVGTSFAGGRGHVEASFEYYDDRGISDMFSRSNGQLWQVEGSNSAAVSSTAQLIAPGTANNPYALYSNVRNAQTSFGGLINSGPLAGMTFSADGVLSAFQHGTLTGTRGYEVGGDGGYFFNTSLKGALLARRAFARVDYDLTDDVHFYAEGFGAFNRNSYNDTSLNFANLVLSAQNPFLGNYRYGTDTTTFTLSKIPLQLGPHNKVFNLDNYYGTAGFEGSLGSKFKWEVNGSYGYSTQAQTTMRNINLQHLYSALDAVSVNGNIVCQINADAITSNDDPSCAPLNFFGPSAASAAAIDYITDVTRSKTTSTLVNFGGSVTGSPFSTWAGPVNLAISGEWRRTTLQSTSEVSPDEKADCTGIRFNACTANTNLHQVTFAIIPLVKQTVAEAAVEAEIPLLADSAIARRLSVNLAGRYANYDSFGGAWTWKAGLDWRVNDELLLRATRSRDFRAPNLSNLYQPTTVSRGTVIDQLTNQTIANAQILTGGNPGLKPEIGNTLTLGFVYKPNWLPGASLSVDGYDINITDAITSLNGSNVTIQRLCNASGGSSALCSLIVRPNGYSDTSAANNATLFYSRSINASSIKTRGIDFELNYNTRLAHQPLSLRVLTTYQPTLKQSTPGIAESDVAGYAYSSVGITTTPKWRMTAMVNYNLTDEVRLTLVERWRSSLQYNADPTLYYVDNKIPAFGWTNLNLSITPKSSWAKDFEFYINVTNLFDQKSPIAINGSSDTGRFGAYISTDDFVGRYFTTGVRARF
ncbi:TonB-dependent receptor domain-containing protein [Sphingomonas sp.]|uniref:TonB-dependent receptor domain-containing protein n=1 Tax=Sphingomonas sp. TaxID=28214 RepID=UPI002CC34EC0|nr:TonB-dependent receptor [Sphingomonas sp.]HWK35426.1 TonB-dependent receptor [Sphingomonas sp.]